MRRREWSGDVVRGLRRRLGLTQEAFAARVGVTVGVVSRWEHDRYAPSKLATAKLEALDREVAA